MGKYGCINGTLDESHYSSFIPIVGILVIIGSVECSLIMVLYTIDGIGRKKGFNKLLSFNSAAMLYLSLASTLVIDLTTPMPSVKDQVAKLSGTALICMSMGVFVPSMVVGNVSEKLWNVFGMFTFMLTATVFIIVQIQSGVIGLFITEHIILLSCSLILFVIMFFCALGVGGLNEKANDDINIIRVFSNSKECMLKRLKLCYIYGFNSNSQFVIGKHPFSATVGGLCLLATVVLLQAAFRSFVSKGIRYCAGTSDYGWSVGPIVVVQILTVIIACFTTTHRWFYFLNQKKIDWNFSAFDIKSKCVLHMNPDLAKIFRCPFSVECTVIMLLGVAMSKIVAKPICCCYRKLITADNPSIEDFKELIGEGDMGLDKWTVQMAVHDMERWIDEASKSKSLEFMSNKLPMDRPSSHQQQHTKEIRDQEHPNRVGNVVSHELHNIEIRDWEHPNQEGIEVSHKLHNTEIKDREHPNQEGNEVSSLSMILLARIAEVSIPASSDHDPYYLLKVFNEAYEIIDFIDSSINSENFMNRKRLKFAKAVMIGSDFSCLVQKIDVNADDQMARTVAILERLKKDFPDHFVRGELCAIIDKINYKEHSSSVKVLYDQMERVFADVLGALLAQLERAISKQVLGSPVGEYEERVRCALRILCILQSSFPQGHYLVSWIEPAA